MDHNSITLDGKKHFIERVQRTTSGLLKFIFIAHSELFQSVEMPSLFKKNNKFDQVPCKLSTMMISRKTRNTFLTHDWYQPIKRKCIYPTPKYVIQQASKMVTETPCITLLNLCESKLCY